LLRRFVEDDAGFVLALLNDPAFLQFIGDKRVRTIDDAKNYLKTGPIESYRKYGYGLLLVELRETKTPIGMCGILKRDQLQHPDLGFAFLPDYRNQGYAFESASAVMSHARDILSINQVLAIVNTDNHRSIKLLEKLGFKFKHMIQLSEDASEIKLFEMCDTL